MDNQKKKDIKEKEYKTEFEPIKINKDTIVDKKSQSSQKVKYIDTYYSGDWNKKYFELKN